MTDEPRSTDRDVAVSEQNLDQQWQHYREAVETLTGKEAERIWAITFREDAPIGMTPREWSFIRLGAQLSIKQAATNAVSRKLQGDNL